MTLWDYLLWAELVVQVAVVALAIRAYIAARTRAFALLLAACVSLVVARSSWFVFPFGAGLLIGHADRVQRALVFHLGDRIGVAFQLLSFVLFVAALLSFIREHRANATQTI